MENKIVNEILFEKNIDNFENDIISILSNYYNLNNYITNINIKNRSSYSLLDLINTCEYNYFDMSINLYKLDINNYIRYRNKLYDELDENDKLFYKKIIILEIIRHEIEHVIQFRDYYINKLNNLSLKYIIEKDKNIKDKVNRFYEFDPMERIADIEAYKFIINILNIIDTKSSLLKLENYYYDKSLLRGYDSILYPTKYFFIMLGNDYLNNFNKIRFNINSLEDKMYYGLEISKDEYEKKLIKNKNMIK